ncbi:Clp protease N-terminal domain-containing protein [Kutzneria sp. NPDC052558]|uniref:Clp protease N-terminal domain-containing protein n=1 Tax=Kutzneria sp. NPDC052558 TaxID=3364121 RepID=UPI0037C54FEE
MSEQTSRLLAVARQEARAQVSSGHLLLGALRPDGDDVLRRVNLDVDLDEIRDHVRVLTAGASDPHARLSTRVKRVLTEHRSTRDVVVALLDDAESTAARALVRAGLDPAEVCERVRRMPGIRRRSRASAKQSSVPPPPEIQPL